MTYSERSIEKKQEEKTKKLKMKYGVIHDEKVRERNSECMCDSRERVYQIKNSKEQVHVCKNSMTNLLSTVPIGPDHRPAPQDQSRCEYTELIE